MFLEFVMVPKELIAASTRPLVLSVLARGDDYGYAIIQRVRKLSGGELEWSEGMLYPVLHRLEKEKLIQSQWRTGESGRRRKYYRLTAGGRKAMQTEKTQWMTVHQTLTKSWRAKPCPS